MADKSKFLIRKHWIVVKCYDLTEFLRYVYIISRCKLNYQGLNHLLHMEHFLEGVAPLRLVYWTIRATNVVLASTKALWSMYFLQRNIFHCMGLVIMKWLSQRLIFLFRLFQIQLYHITMVSKAVFNTKFWFHLLTFLW